MYRMIIVKFCSGLGNQLYQYAFYRAMEIRYPEQKIFADISVFDDIEKLNIGNGFDYGFAVDKFFKIDLHYATRDMIKTIEYEIYFPPNLRKLFSVKFCHKYAGASRLAAMRARLIKRYSENKKNYLTNIPANAYNGKVLYLHDNENYYAGGLWQNYRYFCDIEDELRKSFIFRYPLSDAGKRIENMIHMENSVCIHVRRGDFTCPKNKFAHDICGKEYYYKAIRKICERVPNPRYFVFSDDIEYCKKLFKNLNKITYVSGENGLRVDEEMNLMSKCRHAIIANSTFAFWGVWITDTPEKIVICPNIIFRDEYKWCEFSVPAHWIKIDNL